MEKEMECFDINSHYSQEIHNVTGEKKVVSYLENNPKFSGK